VKTGYLKMILMSMCLLLLMICIHIGITNPLDSFVYHFLDTTIQNYGLIIYLEVISVVFAPINCLFMILVILSVLYFYNPFKFWWYGWWSFSVLLIGTLFKYIIQRTRPDMSIDGYSFPSMHVLSVCLLVCLILLLNNSKSLAIISMLLVISVMISRIYLQAHYFTDTVGSLFVMGTMLQAIQLGQCSSVIHQR